jgi:hypothetical protein
MQTINSSKPRQAIRILVWMQFAQKLRPYIKMDFEHLKLKLHNIIFFTLYFTVLNNNNYNFKVLKLVFADIKRVGVFSGLA